MDRKQKRERAQLLMTKPVEDMTDQELRGLVSELRTAVRFLGDALSAIVAIAVLAWLWLALD